MKHCNHCDIDIDNAYNLCPYCGQDLDQHQYENTSDTTSWETGTNAHGTSTQPQGAPNLIFEEVDRHTAKINGVVIESATQQYYQSKLTKVIQAFFHGEPYQLSHTTFVTVFRVQEHVLRGFAEQARDIVVYGNMQNVLSAGDDVTVIARSYGGHYIAKSIYNHSINSHVKIQASLLPAWLIRLLVIIPLVVLGSLLWSLLSTPPAAIMEWVLLIIIRCWPLIALACGWKWLVNKFKKK